MDPTDREVDDFSLACNAVYTLMHRNRSRMLADHDSGQLTESQLAIVTPLARYGELTVGRVAEHARVSQPTATRALSQLADSGIVTRTRAENGGRFVRISLTHAGEVALRNTTERMREAQRRALQRFAPERRHHIVEMLNELAQAIDDTSN